MDKNYMNISKVESFLMSILENNLGDATYVYSPPSTLPSTLTNFSVISINNVIDMDGYGRATALIYLYGKPLSNGSKNASKISQMATKLNEIIENNKNTNYVITRRSTYSDYDSNRSWYFDVVELIIKIY